MRIHFLKYNLINLPQSEFLQALYENFCDQMCANSIIAWTFIYPVVFIFFYSNSHEKQVKSVQIYFENENCFYKLNLGMIAKYWRRDQRSSPVTTSFTSEKIRRVAKTPVRKNSRYIFYKVLMYKFLFLLNRWVLETKNDCIHSHFKNDIRCVPRNLSRAFF